MATAYCLTDGWLRGLASPVRAKTGVGEPCGGDLAQEAA